MVKEFYTMLYLNFGNSKFYDAEGSSLLSEFFSAPYRTATDRLSF
jgi:hypothetical protein